MQSEQVQELLELCWVAGEDHIGPLDRNHLPTHLLCYAPKAIEPQSMVEANTVELMIREGLLTAEGPTIRLSPKGKEKAEELIRRHRLTEVLLHNVLNVSEDSMESFACQAEHILNPEVTDAVCSFLGHPPVCPHGREIPKGPCCLSEISTLEPLIVPLDNLTIGQSGSVAFIHTTRGACLKQLASFGVVPGTTIYLKQTRPTLVIKIGKTDLALDLEAGQEIFVKRIQGTP